MKKKEKTKTWYRKKCVERAKKIAIERDGGLCQRCGKSKQDGWQIHGSHVFPEGKYHGMSANTENIKALCAQCHMWWHENPIASSEWFREKFPKRYKKLKSDSLKTIQLDWKKEYMLLCKHN